MSTEKVVYKTFKELYEEELYKNQILNNIITEYNLESVDDLINIVDDHVNKKCNSISIPSSNLEDKLLQEELKSLGEEKRRSVYYDTSEDIGNNNDIIKLTSEISNLTKIIEENQINHKKEVDDLKSYYDEIIDELKKEDKKDEVPLPSPSTSSESNTKLQLLQKKNFWNKKLPILERCKVISYTYDKTLYSDDKELQILEYVSGIHKYIIKFNSDIANRIDVNDKKMWEKIYMFKVFNGDIQDKPYNKKRVKYEYIRCKELYKIYNNNLKYFRIYTNYLGMLNKDEWKEYLEEFDKLYKSRINKEKLCTFILKKGNRKGQECSKLKCKMHS
jgi:hypothetical protein